MIAARQEGTLRCVLAAMLIFAAFHICGHESFCAATAQSEHPPGDLPLASDDLGGSPADATSCSAAEHASAGCDGDDCLCLCRTPGLSPDAPPLPVPLVHAGDVMEVRNQPSRDIPYRIDRPPRLS